MNVASKELCEELYKLSGWNRTEYLWASPPLSPNDWRPIHKSDLHRINDDLLPDTMYNSTFAYDLGYLLRKLPAEVEEFSETDHLTYELLLAKYEANEFHADYWWNDDLRFNMVPSGTPEDALVTLAIELFKQGVLTREAA